MILGLGFRGLCFVMVVGPYGVGASRRYRSCGVGVSSGWVFGGLGRFRVR